MSLGQALYPITISRMQIPFPIDIALLCPFIDLMFIFQQQALSRSYGVERLYREYAPVYGRTKVHRISEMAKAEE